MLIVSFYLIRPNEKGNSELVKDPVDGLEGQTNVKDITEIEGKELDNETSDGETALKDVTMEEHEEMEEDQENGESDLDKTANTVIENDDFVSESKVDNNVETESPDSPLDAQANVDSDNDNK